MSAVDPEQSNVFAPQVERRRPGRADYTNPHLMQMLREEPLSDRELLQRRFDLARRAVALARSATLTEQNTAARDAVRLELEAAEAECRRRGLIRS